MTEFERMDQLITSFIDTCCKLENLHEGLTKSLMTSEMKKNIAKLDKAYHDCNLTGFILVLNNIRNEWMNGINKLTQQEMNV